MKLVHTYDEVWKMSNAKYKKFLRDMSHDKECFLDDYGKHIGRLEMSVTDLTADEAREFLIDLTKKEGRKRL